MGRVIWSPRAAADLEELCDYIANDSVRYARIVAKLIVNVVEEIPEFPKSGRVVPELEDPNVREKIVGNFRVIYRLKPDVIEVVTIIHGARTLKRGT